MIATLTQENIVNEENASVLHIFLEFATLMDFIHQRKVRVQSVFLIGDIRYNKIYWKYAQTLHLSLSNWLSFEIC